jgi:hypothetical protein
MESDVKAIFGGLGASVVFAIAALAPLRAGAGPPPRMTQTNLTIDRPVCEDAQFRVAKEPCRQMVGQTPVVGEKPNAKRQPFYYLGSGKNHQRGPLYGEPRP